MATTVAELVARLRADTTEFTRGLASANRSVDASAARMKNLGDSATQLGRKLSIGVSLPIAAAAFAGFRELEESAKVAAQTNAVLKSTGGVANVTAKGVQSLARRLSELSGTDDEAIAAGQNLLLTFKNVRNEAGKGNAIFTKATKLALDLSIAWGQDMHSSAIQLGKALEDPIRGVTALRRVGVQFSASQEKMIRALVESGDLLGAQKIILKELETQVGGSAKAYGETLGGQVGRAREALKNAAADIVGTVAPALETLAGWLSKVADFISGMPKWAKTGFAALAGAAATLGPLLVVVGSIARNLAAIKAFRAGKGLAGLAGAAGGAAPIPVPGKAGGVGSKALLGAGLGGPGLALGALVIGTEMFAEAHTSQIEKTFKMFAKGSKNAKPEMKELAEDLKNITRSSHVLFGGSRVFNNWVSQIVTGFKAIAQQSPEAAASFLKMAKDAEMPFPVVMQLRAALGSLAGNFHANVTADISDALAKATILANAYAGLNFGFGRVSLEGIMASRGYRRTLMGWMQWTLMGWRPVQQLQFGGPVMPQRPYVVGEAGPELFVPNTSGTIIPNHKMNVGGAAPLQVVVNVSGSVLSERQLVDVVREGIRRGARQGQGTV